jgi:hypothetical protein
VGLLFFVDRRGPERLGYLVCAGSIPAPSRINTTATFVLSGCGPEQDGYRESTRVTTGGRGFKSCPADFDGR